MYGRLSLALVVALVAVQAATAAHIVKEQIEDVPAGWTRLDRASGSQELELMIMIKQSNADLLLETFHAVSDPQSPRYGQYLSLDEVNALTAPKEQHIASVMQWLNKHQIRTTKKTLTMSPARDMIRVRTTVAKAEALLHTEYHEYAHATRKTQLVRAMHYKVPTYLADAIDVIGPTVRFPSHWTVQRSQARKAKAPRKRLSAANPCSFGTTPACLKATYNVNDYVAAAGTNTSVAVTGYLEQYISPADLATFFSLFDANHTRTATIVGPNVATQPGTEASLDIQYSMGVAPGVPGTFWYTAGRQPNSTDNEPFLDFLMALQSDANAPWVISTSYGDDEPTVNYNYATRVNQEFQEAAVRGLSVLFSSGDGGVSGGQPQQCTQFIPTYPAGSPYITSVGGTTNFGPEVAVSFSSGGFSNYWPGSDAPYQQSAVQNFLQTAGANLPAAGLFNATGRGFPDVSAQGTNYPVVQGGFPMPVDGTSCSTPTFAAIVSLLNDVRFAAGKSALGFLNPLFYQNPSMFNDITSGSNPGCGTNGFTAQAGWDPVTGLGTPNFEAMSSVVKNLP